MKSSKTQTPIRTFSSTTRQAPAQLTVTIRYRWWFTHIYVPGLRLTHNLLNYLGYHCEPNQDRIRHWGKKAAVITTYSKKILKPC